MAKQCTTEKSLERQNRIGKALEEMMMEQDYEDIFVSDLCTRAGISRRSFYRYFSGKDDVLRSLLEDIIRDCPLQAVFKFCPDRDLEERLVGFFRYWMEKQSHWLEILARNRQESLLIDMYVDWTRQEYLEGKNLGTHDRNLVSVALEVASTGLLMTLFRWARTGYHQSPGEMANYLAKVMTRPLYDNFLENLPQL